MLLVSCAPDDIDAAQRELDDRARLYSEVVDIETRIVGHGDPAEVLLAIAATEPDGVLCMATRGKGAIRAKVLGSVSTKVVCGSMQPFILVGPNCRTTLLPAERGRLLVCSDGSALSDSIVPRPPPGVIDFSWSRGSPKWWGPTRTRNPRIDLIPTVRSKQQGALDRWRPTCTHRHLGRGPESSTAHRGGRFRGSRASSRRVDRPRDSRPQRIDPYHHGQRRHRSRSSRPVSGSDHTADGRPRVRRRVTPHNPSEGDQDG